MIVIDRFEGNLAIIENDGKTLIIERAALPESAKEGDMLMLTDEGGYALSDCVGSRKARLMARLRRLCSSRSTK